MIRFEDVTKVFRDPDGTETVAVRNLSLTVEEGEIHCLIGTSGCGKTTTMRMVNRLEEPTSGTVLIDKEDVRDQDVIRLRRRIGYVIQSGGLFPHKTVGGNVGLLCGLEGWDRERVRERVRELLELVNLPPDRFEDRYPAELSGGQRQRIGVARALALDPEYVLMDEPFGALDPITRSGLHDEFLQLQQKVGKTIMLVTHDLDEAFHLGDRISVMNHGELVQTGTAQDLRDNPADAFVSEFVSGRVEEEG